MAYSRCAETSSGPDLEHCLSLANGLAGNIDVEAFDVTLEFGRDREDAALIRLDSPGCADYPAQISQLGGFRTYPIF